MDYHPREMAMWDTWCIEHQGQAHMIHLQIRPANSPRPDEDKFWLGHAVSRDLVHWEERPQAFGPGPAGAMDDHQPWTGCMAKHNGRFYLYYTMRSWADWCSHQRIGLATCDDLEHWVRHAGNPVIDPDGRWYVSGQSPLPRGLVDCRDLIVVRDPDGHGWLGFFAARVKGSDLNATPAVAAARSSDLVHWQQLPPVFAPGRYSCLEVPDVFELNGRWYLTLLAGYHYGNRGYFTQPDFTRGTIYAVADHPLGPYREIEGDNVLIGGDATCGYSCRSLLFEGQRYTFYTQPAVGGLDSVSPPMRVVTLRDGRLRLAYSDRQQAWRRQRVIDPAQPPAIASQPFCHGNWEMPAGQWRLEGGRYAGHAGGGWQAATLGVGAADIEMSARVVVEQGVAAGLIYHPSGKRNVADESLAFLVNVGQQCIEFNRLAAFDKPLRYHMPLESGREYHLRVVIRRPRIEVYVDDILVLQLGVDLGLPPEPTVGLLVDRATAHIRAVEAFALGESK